MSEANRNPAGLHQQGFSMRSTHNYSRSIARRSLQSRKRAIRVKDKRRIKNVQRTKYNGMC